MALEDNNIKSDDEDEEVESEESDYWFTISIIGIVKLYKNIFLWKFISVKYIILHIKNF